MGFRKAIFAFAILVLCASADAANWYIDNTASGLTNGTSWANAWYSPSNIVWASIQAGDTIYISGGATSKTYDDQLYVDTVSGLPNAKITFRAGQDSGHTGIARLTRIWIGYSANWVIDGEYGAARHIVVSNQNNTGVSFYLGSNHIVRYVQVDSAGDVDNEHGIAFNTVGATSLVERCFIQNTFTDGINYTDSSGNAPTNLGSHLISYTTVTNAGDDCIQCIGGTTVEDCDLTCSDTPMLGAHPDGIQMGVDTFNNIVRRCVIRNANQGIFAEWRNGNTYVYNNIILNNRTNAALNSTDRGFTINTRNWRPGDVVLVANNAFYNFNTYMAFILESPTTNAVIFENNLLINNRIHVSNNSGFTIGTNNLCYSVPGWGFFDSSSPFPPATGDTEYVTNGIRADPLCVSISNPASPNFDLQAGSPAIGHGTNLSAYFTTDIRGRVRSATWDIGPYAGPSKTMRATTIRGNLRGPY